MYIVETSTNYKHNIEILSLEDEDYKSLSKSRYFFDWKIEKEFEVFKLKIFDTNDILGLISIQRIPEEWRVHIRLLTVSKENMGRFKKYDLITGNLIAFAAKIAVADFGEFACVSLRPKTQLALHYIEKYNMRATGMTLSIEVPEIIDLINHYDNE